VHIWPQPRGESVSCLEARLLRVAGGGRDLPRGKTVVAPRLRLRLASGQDSLAHELEWAVPPSSDALTFG
jgi:hypothetical protein